MSWPLFKQIARSNYRLFLIITLVLSVYLTVVIAVFTPTNLGNLTNIAASIPGIGALLSEATSLLGFMSKGFYTIIGIIFPMVYSIIVGNKLIAEQVDKGGMAFYLSTPTKRTRIALTGATYFVLSLVLMFLIVSVVGLVAGRTFQPDQLDTSTFLTLNLGCFLLHFAISGLTFMSSCVFNRSKNSIAVGAGFPLAFFMFELMSQLDPQLEFLKYFSLDTLFDTKAILSGEGYAFRLVLLAVVGIVLYSVGIKVFKEKDLPL